MITTTTTATAMDTITSTAEQGLPVGNGGLLRLLSWLSPAFPTGAFAYSHGLEWAVERGAISDRATLVAWLEDLLRHGSGRSDAIVVRHAWHTPPGPALRALADQALALCASRERAEESIVQGAAFAKAMASWIAVPEPISTAGGEDWSDAWPLPVVIGACFHAAGLDEETTVLGALHGFVANAVSAAVRLVPLGQTDGLRALSALELAMLAAVEATRGLSIDDAGGFCFGAELSAMLHETQNTRLFRS